MAYNSKQLKTRSTAKGSKTDPYKKDIIVDPQGQWAHPGEITRIPSGSITMEGVGYPVLGIDNLGNQLMMYPGEDYQFPGDSVTEYPQLKNGGLPGKKTTNKNVKTSINEFMKRNQDLFGPKGKRYYIPGFPDGGPTSGKPVQGNATMNWQVPVLNIDPQPTKTYPPGQSPEELKKAAQDKYLEENKNIQGWIRETYYDNESGSNRTEMRPIPVGQPIPTNGTFVPKQYTDTATSMEYGGSMKNKKGKSLSTPPTAAQFFERGFVPNSPVGFYKQGGQPCYECGGYMQQGGGTSYVDPNFLPPVIDPMAAMVNNEVMQIPSNFQGRNYHYSPATALNEEEEYYKTLGDRFKNVFTPNQPARVTYAFQKGGWIQDATKNIRQDKPCTGAKFGGPDCPPGSQRYNLAKTFREMAKKQFGGDVLSQDVINQFDEDDYISNYSKTFMDKLKDNTMVSIADDAADNVNQANEEFFAQFGMQVPTDYGYNPNMMGQQMFSDKSNYLDNQGQNAINNFYKTSMGMMATASPFTDWTVAQNGASVPSGMSQDQFFAYMDAYNKRSQTPNTTPNYQSQWQPQNMQGMGNFPMNSNPRMNWNVQQPGTTSQGYPVPGVGFNPENTYLQSFDYRGRLLGPGARKVSMTFRTYIDPATGQATQVPAPAGQQSNSPVYGPSNMDPNTPTTSFPVVNQPGQSQTYNSGLNLIPEKNFDDFQLNTPFNRPPFTEDTSTYLTPEERKRRDKMPVDLRTRFLNLQQNMQERSNRNLPPQRESGVHPGFLQYGGIPKAQFGMNAFGQPDAQFQGPLSPEFVDQNTAGSEPAYFDTTVTGKRKMGLDPEASANWLLSSITGATALANRGEQAQTQDEMQRLTLADNVFNPMPANRIQNQGRYNWTGMSNGMMDPNSMGVIQQPGQNYTGMYKEGGEYELSEDEINYIMKNGGSITYL